MSNNTTADVTGIFSLDTNRLVGLAAKGSPDVTYLAGQDTPTSGIPLTVTTSSDGGVVTTDPRTGQQTEMSVAVRSTVGLPLFLGFGCSIEQQCNAYLHSTTSTLSAVDLKAGATVLPVANGGLFTAGQKIAVPLYNARLWTTTILSVAGNDLTIADKTPGLIRASSVVTICTTATVPSLDQGYGAHNAAIALLGGPVEFLPCYGYGGATYTQMYADLERDLRYYRPHYVGLHMYENDMTSSVASGGATIEQFKAWARQMSRLCLRYGATPIVYSSMPYYNAGAGRGIPASRDADYDALATYVGSGTSGQLSIDVPGAWGDNSLSYGWLDTSNPTWPRAPAAGWTDGVHPNTNKRFAVGLIALPVLQKLLPPARSRLEQVVTPLEVSRLDGSGGVASNLQAGSVVPKSHTIVAYGAAVLTTSRNADGSIKLSGSWPGAASRSADYLVDKFTYTFPGTWSGGTQRFRQYVRIRINSMVGIAQIYPEILINPTGEDHTGQTGIDMCDSIPADGRIMVLETPQFAIGVGATTLQPSITIKPKDAASPSGASIDIDILEMGIIPCVPEVPHSYV